MFVGIKALKPRQVNVYQLFIIPSVLIAARYQVFMSEHLMVYVLGLTVGAGLGWVLTSKGSAEIIPASKNVKLPGSYTTLVLLLSFFVLKYAFGYLTSVQHPIALEYGYVEVTFSAMLSGYFLGRASLYVSKIHIK